MTSSWARLIFRLWPLCGKRRSTTTTDGSSASILASKRIVRVSGGPTSISSGNAARSSSEKASNATSNSSCSSADVRSRGCTAVDSAGRERLCTSEHHGGRCSCRSRWVPPIRCGPGPPGGRLGAAGSSSTGPSGSSRACVLASGGDHISAFRPRTYESLKETITPNCRIERSSLLGDLRVPNYGIGQPDEMAPAVDAVPEPAAAGHLVPPLLQQFAVDPPGSEASLKPSARPNTVYLTGIARDVRGSG